MKLSSSAIGVGLVLVCLPLTAATASAPEPSAGSQSNSQKRMTLTASLWQGADLQAREKALKAGKKSPPGKPAGRTRAQVEAAVRSADIPFQRYVSKLQPVRKSSGMAPAYSLQDPLADPITASECLGSAQAGQQYGWIKNRFMWCERWAFSVRVDIDGIPSGNLWGKAMLINKGTSGSTANMRYDWQFTELNSDGVVADNPDEFIIENNILTDPTRPPVPSACGEDRWVGRRAPLNAWMTNPTSYWWTYPPATGSGRDSVSICEFVPYFRFYHANYADQYLSISPYFASGGQYRNGNGIRCDVATYLNLGAGKRHYGCSFYPVIGLVLFSWSNTDQTEAIGHIYDALLRPATNTYPMYAGKTIPGGANGSEVLHRNWYNTTLKSASSTRVKKECQTHWPGYSTETPPRQCDEFPFNSTFEAAGNGRERFSARAINGHHNEMAGNWLGRWYYYDRITDWEAAFQVWIVP
jgi:hypothetical protein